MKKLILLCFFTTLMCAYQYVLGQPLPCPPVNTSMANAGADVATCPGACALLQGSEITTLKSTSSYTVDTTTYLPYSFKNGTQVIVNIDDIWSPVINIPFDFCFFGQKYNQLVIGSNGNVSFNTALAGTFCNYAVTAPIPNNYASYNNCILAPFYDLDPTVNGAIRYATYGIAPCRVFVVSWDSVSTYNCITPGGGGCPYIGSQQIVLYETTYAIDIFVKDKVFYTGSTSSGFAVLGIQNNSATLAYSYPGRNYAQWSENNKGYRFTPDGNPDILRQWTNLSTGAVVSAADTVTVCITDTTAFEYQVMFYSQCDTIVLKDTVQVNADKSAIADFNFEINYGCAEDTVIFYNTSTENINNIWDFGDGNGSIDLDPVHIYPNQADYTVKLIVSNNNCTDSITKVVDTRHPLRAAFTANQDSICQGTLVNFTNTSIYTEIKGPVSFFWDFKDGNTSTLQNPSHTFLYAGVYDIQLVVKDFIPCYDTAYFTIVVDSAGTIDFVTSDSSLCEGQGITFLMDYTDVGLLDIALDFGDGNVVHNTKETLHAYDAPGTYDVTLTGTYRICPNITKSKSIFIHPFPRLSIGSDTAMCPNGEPLIIGDNRNLFAGGSWLWNTGAATQFIAVRHPGIYTAKVTMDGCSTSDSIEVFKDCYIDIPNVFTPNGDGMNDYFLPRQLLSEGIVGFKMLVFNRWGQLVFETEKLDGRGWDGQFNGTPQPTGVYVYLIDVFLKSGMREHYEGNVTLMR